MTLTHAPGRRWLLSLIAAGSVLAGSAHRAIADKAGPVPDNPDDRTIQHVLNRLGFGPRPGDVQRVRTMGLATYIEQQLAPERVPDTALEARLADLPTVSMSASELNQRFFQPIEEAQRAFQLQKNSPSPSASADSSSAPAPQVPPALAKARQNAQTVVSELTQAHLLREALSERQLDEVLVDFWFNHFNVFAGKGQVREYLPQYERDVIRPYVLGSFRDLLGAVAHSPAMLFYLDNWQSSAPNAQVMPPQLEQRLGDPRLPPWQRQQLLARWQAMQNQRKQPRGLNENYGRELMELHTLGVDGGYTQKDVVEVARALTGWTIDRRSGGEFIFRREMHDAGEKIILGQKFPAGRGEDEGERVLDILAKHPSTAHHIAFQLAQRFVADDPPPALVDRAAKTFLETNGDLRKVVRVIITSPEFFAPEAYRAKMKTPLEFVISALRASNANVASVQPVVQALRAQLGMPVFGCQPPTGYSDTADAWVNTGALLNRMNFALQIVSGQMRAIRVDVAAMAQDTSDAARDQVIHSVLGGDVSASTRQVLAKATTPEQLVALALGSPDFQRR